MGAGYQQKLGNSSSFMAPQRLRARHASASFSHSTRLHSQSQEHIIEDEKGELVSPELRQRKERKRALTEELEAEVRAEIEAFVRVSRSIMRTLVCSSHISSCTQLAPSLLRSKCC
jgi:hypothetical protein